MEKIKNMDYFHLTYQDEQEKNDAVMYEANEFCKGNRDFDYEAEESIKKYLYSCIINLANKKSQSA